MRLPWGLLISIALVVASIQAVPAQEPIKLGVVGSHSGPALGGQTGGRLPAGRQRDEAHIPLQIRANR